MEFPKQKQIVPRGSLQSQPMNGSGKVLATGTSSLIGISASPLADVSCPLEMRNLKGWLSWKSVQKPGEAKPRKVPFYADGGVRGAHGTPEDFRRLTTFDVALASAIERGFDGVGFAPLKDFGLVVLDLDDIVQNDVLLGRALTLVGDTYVEYSPSGKGLHAFVRGTAHNKKSFAKEGWPFSLEVFHGTGFVTFTGKRIEGAPNEISDMPAALLEEIARRWPPIAPSAYRRGSKEPEGYSELKVAEALTNLDPSMCREGWIKVGMALHHESGGEWFEVWDNWSSNGSNYPGRDSLQVQWISFNRPRGGSAAEVTIGTLRQMLVEVGRPMGGPVADASDFDVMQEHTLEEKADVIAPRGNIASQLHSWLPPGRLFNPWTEVIAPPFPLETLPEPMARYVRAKEQEVGVCPSAVAMCALVAASAALTHESRLYLKNNNNFEVRPALWVVLVGDSSFKKTPAMQATRPLRKIEAELRSLRETTILMTASDEGGGKGKTDTLPPSRRFIVIDVTMEKLGDILSKQDSGILLEKDELSSLIGSFDQYGVKGGEANRGFYLSAYNGQSHNIERISRDTLPIRNLSLSILAGVQMKKLQEFKKLDSDGLLQRFLPVMMRAPALDSDEFDGAASPAWENLLRTISARDPSCVHLTPEAMAERRSFANRMDELVQASRIQGNDSFTAYLGKMPGTWGRIALNLHALHGLAPEADLPRDIAAMSTKIVDDFLVPNGLVFYNTLTQKLPEDQQSIGAFLAAFEAPVVQWRDLNRGPRCMRGIDLKKAHELLVPFMAGGWLTPVSSFPNNNSWKLHPGVGEYFRKETKRHQLAVAMVQAKIAGRSEDPPMEGASLMTSRLSLTNCTGS